MKYIYTLLITIGLSLNLFSQNAAIKVAGVVMDRMERR